MITFGRKLPIGIQTFKDIRTQGYLYVDKTDLVWQIANVGKPFFLSRPRRFGKTLNMIMMEQFFSIEYQGREELFEGLSIWEEEKFRKLQGTYPVLFLSFADIKSKTYAQARKEMICLIVGLYNK